MHPSGQEKEGWYKILKKYANLSVVKDVDLYELLTKSKYLIVESSTVGLEAPMFDTDVIVLTVSKILKDYAKHPLYFKADNPEDINSILKNSSSKIKKFKNDFIRKYLFRNDRKTHLRIKSALERLLNELKFKH